ncbi:tRNA (adenosine(37)-N6)-threonylcarbamoyltransferase complex dimerization subunit type 1 TsaB [Pseudomonas syringae]|uniref:tRNA (adenosine(37)-N6)-threonylcarbamoyltransferase complex dimerization subunit type 1 TsaB n=1 Tax=Pseudomonas syringae TaxID=317 RepID=UPI000409E4F8|nr:tRNA (adenosine(37)-N6)-threonylcarbamoyltransferase complex dimerization subunit type 1 TsaB [Pseudomonas syringae]MBI6672048.1 tRNA (adenosine(37)-N6)-threonylcarbamoyltransferase complex dimerization subunit type 1 TsaB [Pseudomonas syringae]UOF21199.1 tRNA (adenosine(37)-N6)-threonylcarbamoyltransferase complex dimerization subunit type 1 TsaB [Pseudomonas syringae CC440]UZA78769.1 tRNA (adenosine(37)-N6)-threonylcarbamoyltransferase complex dimerization subunit type 1 TsaB [Pseudomonas s
MTTLLALDTATEACSVALLHDGKVLSHYEVIPRLHAQRLLPMIKTLMAEAGIAMSALDAIAFGRGPGAFTGVRIAIGVVQGLAFALERPVLPVSNLAVLAQRAWREHGVSQVASAIDARMDEVYWGCYHETVGEMRLLGDEAVMAPELATLPAQASGQWFGAGTGWGYAERIPVSLAGHDVAMLPHAQDLLTLATFAWHRGEALPADDAQPVYLRDKVATPKAR